MLIRMVLVLTGLGALCLAAAIWVIGDYAAAFVETHVVSKFDDLEQHDVINVEAAVELLGTEQVDERCEIAWSYLLGDGAATRHIRPVMHLAASALALSGVMNLFAAWLKRHKPAMPRADELTA